MGNDWAERKAPLPLKATIHAGSVLVLFGFEPHQPPQILKRLTLCEAFLFLLLDIRLYCVGQLTQHSSGRISAT